MKLSAEADGTFLREWHWDEDGGGRLIHNVVQDVAPILKRNKALQNCGDNGYGKSRDFRRVASIPLVVVDKWLREGVDIFNPDHAKEVKRRLNSSEWAHLRTADGRF